MTQAIRDAHTVFVRQSLPTWRSPSSLLFGMLQPLVFLVFFGPLLGDLTESMPGQSSWQWFVPSVLMMLALFGTTGTGYNLLTEMETGSHQRLLVTPLSRSAMLAGRTLNDVFMLVIQAVLIVAVMLPFGFRLHLGGALLAVLLLAVLAVAVGALSHALAIASRKNPEMFYGVQQTLLFPLLFLSGLMLPLEFGPAWMQTLGRLNPFTYVVDGVRDLFDGHILSAAVGRGWIAASVLAVVGVWVGTRAMRRSTG